MIVLRTTTTASFRRAATARAGATLTEVLMAILIMSIGVTSVITLFPLAILRAVVATQLTNSKVLEDNIEEFVNTNNWMLRGSPVDPRLNSDSTDPMNTDWPNYGNLACVIDPLGRQILGNQFGNQGGSTPTWALRRISPFAATPTPIPSYLTTAANTNWSTIERTWADQGVCALPDSWVVQADDVPTNVTATAVTFANNFGATGGKARVTVISANGTRSATRRVTLANNVATLDTGEPNLPTYLDSPGEVSRAVVDANESRYSWIITCPIPSAAPPAANCAVFFRRSFNPEEEFLYDNGGSAPFDTTPTSPDTASTVNISWAATDPPPLLREGNFVFDAQFAFWYRIRSYEADYVGRTAKIELDQPARANGSGIMIPHGLIHVFELELRGQK